MIRLIRPTRRLVTALAAASGLLLASSATSAGQSAILADYTLESWTTKDGLPSNVIWSLAQDREGYLWLGTNGGLARFDGVRFVTLETVGGVSLPKAPVRTVFAARDGSLWLGFSEAGGISRIKDGQVRNYDVRDGLAHGVVNALAEDRHGTIWAGSGVGLFRLNGDHWERPAPSGGLPEARVDSAYIDRRGDLLVGTAVGIFRRALDTDLFERIDAADDAPTFRSFTEDASGRLWVSDPVVGFRRVGERRTIKPGVEKGRGNRLLHDRGGDLWVATMGEGLWRVRHDASAPGGAIIERARVLGARSMLEDRDGVIWAGAGDGLVRLTKPRVTPITDLGLVTAVDATPDGRVWVSTVDELVRFAPGAGQSQRVRVLSPAFGISALHADADGTVWTSAFSGLVRITASGLDSLPLPESSGLTHINSLTTDRKGNIWISDRDRGLFRWDRTPHLSGLQRIVEHANATSTYADSIGRVWFGTASGRLGVADADGRVRYYGPQDGLATGPYNAICEDRRHTIWVGGSDGLSRLVGDRFVRLGEVNRFRGGVIAIVDDDDGDLWLGTGSGIVCIRRSEIDAAAARPRSEVRYTVFDAADGLAGMPVRFGGNSGVRSADGRLWFVTGRGLTVIQPRALKVPHAPAQVKIEDVLVDEQPATLDAASSLPPSTNRLQIDYTVLQLGSPQTVRFRYRLEGFDADWVDAGTRRQALYMHLPPGSYRFHVVASNSDGSWSDVGSAWRFTLRPTFYQTRWFAALCVAAIGLATWAAWQLRLRRIRRQFAVLLGERVRLSRELHDTLLQSLVGVALQFDAASGSIDPSSPAHQQLVRIRKQVEDYIREARHSIWNLRSPILSTRDLATALRESGERATFGKAVQFALRVDGTPSPSSPIVDEQLLRIGQEGILNAIRHARASRVEVDLTYDADAVVLRVCDDGLGFDAGRPAGETAGHYGLVSMRERAEQVGGQFTLKTTARAGTTVEVVVPAQAAH